ncbi:hypothetical protein ES5_02074, partial [Dietzia cinnamea P4]
ATVLWDLVTGISILMSYPVILLRWMRPRRQWPMTAS